MAVPVIVADFESSLSTAIAVGGTSFTLSSATDDDGVALPSGTYYFTVDNGASNKEYFLGTLSGSSVTGLYSVSRQGVETSGAARAHRVGASVIITDFATYKKYMDGIAIAGAPNAAVGTIGITKLSTAPVSPTNPIAVGDNDVRMPTASGAQFISATTGMISMYGGTAAPTGFLPCDGAAVSRTTYAALFTVIGTSYGVGDGTTTFNVPDGRGRTFIGSGTGTKVATFASRASNVITVTGLTNAANNEFQTGQAVLYSAPSGAMTGLTHNTTYYLVRTGNLTFSLASSLANAQNGTVISLSSDGTGVQTFTLTLTARTTGDTGGENNHAMSLTELLSHTHPFNASATNSGVVSIDAIDSDGSSAQIFTPPTAGGNAAMNNMQPFFAGLWIIKT